VPKLLKACPEPFRGEVLEVGAGSGWSSRRILDTFPQVELTATDVDTRAKGSFERLRGKYGQRLVFKQANLMKLPFDRGSFDIVLAIHMLHYAYDLREAIRQFIRVVRPGGLLGMSDVNPKYQKGPWKSLFSASSMPTRKLLEEMLVEEGCEILTSHGEVNYFIWARKPYPINPGS
jgi:ubiquinone/menaquinone biosynthesis C-methylase UbiE